jgi:hypothetical protein
MDFELWKERQHFKKQGLQELIKKFQKYVS